MSDMSEIQQLFEWRKRERAKHRVMTWAEYRAWCKAGDTISGPHESNPFPGGISIQMGPDDGIMGRTVSDSTATS